MRRPLVARGAAGVVVGLAGSVGLLVLSGVAIAHRVSAPERDAATLIDATHLPPLLTVAGEPVTLRYDIYCAPPGADPESGAPCDAAGTVYVRPGDSGPFRALKLELDPTASEGRYRVIVPPEITGVRSGFSYYAVLRSNTTHATTTLPAGGPFAPQRSRPLAETTTVPLGEHEFGSVRPATARVAAASWGTGAGEVGLEQGPEVQPIGGSSFDVDAGGVVSLLDEANRRVLRFAPGAAGPTAVAVDVRGTIADLAVGPNGVMAVLETVGDDGKTPFLRSFDAAGRSLGSWHIAERGASAVEIGPQGPVALEYPAGQWMPVVENGAGLTPPVQRTKGRAGRLLADGDELVVQREGNELRVARVGPAGVRRSWLITSETPLGEVQLARPMGRSVVVALRVYEEAHDEFEVLVLDDSGVASRFSVGSRDWAETAPLAHFRLRGTSLYALGSTQTGVFVDRYDLEVTR